MFVVGSSRGPRAQRRKAGWHQPLLLTILLAVTTTVVGVAPATVGVAPAAAATGSEKCTEGNVTWRVEYSSWDSTYGTVYAATAFKKTENGTTTDVSNQTWNLRWDSLANVYPPAGTDPPSFQSVQGPLTPSGVGQPVPNYLSPRFVTPDGSCTVYLTPFTNTGADPTTPKVAILGDDLVLQLNDSNHNGSAVQGYVESSLTSMRIRSEVEGHAGRRWTATAGTTGTAKADTHLVDEFRGLLEHDLAGVVGALGRNDALYIAAGATQAERNTRKDEVYNGLLDLLVNQVGNRTGCLAVVTAPQNNSSVDPDYAWSALQVNNFFRFIFGLGNATDNAEMIDFGAEAATHLAGSAQPWFAADNLTLAGAGLTAYTNAITRAAQRCADSVVLWGKPGTLEDSVMAQNDATNLPSGHAWGTRAVEGFDFGPSKMAHFSTIAADGTIFFMTGGSAGNVFAASGKGTTISAFNPTARSFQNIPVKTDRNVAVPLAPCPPDGAGGASWDWCQDEPGGLWEMGGWLGDVGALADGNTVAFTGYQLYMGQNLDTQGQFPVFGLVSRRSDGSWHLEEGPDLSGAPGGGPDGQPDWRNAWSPRELVDATVAAANPNDPQAVAAAQALADELCPVGPTPPARDCGWVNEIAQLPESDDVVISHYGSGKLSVLDLGTPDPATGRITARIAAVYDLPDIHDPRFPADPTKLQAVAPREVQADPSSHLGDERFALQSDFSPTIIEFSYNAGAATNVDRIKPVSAPVLSGEKYTWPWADDPNTPLDETTVQHYIGFGQFLYDQGGNLWVPTWSGTTGLGVKVYTKTSQGRRITRPECLEQVNGQPKPLQDYLTNPSGMQPTWGRVCQADYNILQPRVLGPTYGIEEDPATGNIALTDWAHGITTVVDPDDPGVDGVDLTFRTGNVMSLMAKSTASTDVTGPCTLSPAPPAGDGTCNHNPCDATPLQCTRPTWTGEMQGSIDSSGRLWIPVMQGVPGDLIPDSNEMMAAYLDQYIYSIDLTRLLGREPLQLTARSGQATYVQAEQTSTSATTQPNGTYAVKDVDSVAPVRGCLDLPTTIYAVPLVCSHPTEPIRDGVFELGDETDPDGNRVQGVPAGTTADYRIVVPKGGSYQITLRATDRGAAGAQNLQLSLNGTSSTTEITSAGTWNNLGMRDHVLATPVTLPAGTYTLQVTAPQGGWELDWIKFTRT